jgi:UDP-N-acetylmuramate dehydrogenase
MVSAIRAEKLPDPATTASAGSFFKNIYITEEEVYQITSRGIPIHRGNDGIKINSGWLIEQCGLSGQLIYGIRVNPKASLVLINESAKSFNELAAARNFIVNTVLEKYGFKLQQEPVELV